MKLISGHKRCSVLDANPDELAAQLTLIDLAMFKAIKRDEFLQLGRSVRKQERTPNIVAMNKQFNQVTFWVVGQILLHDSAKARAELISHFIRTAKCLSQLNNLHSSYAILSALLSLPIYRLAKTWHVVKKKYQKEKQQLDQMLTLYSDSNNYETLRNHLDQCELPCIPYLGVFFRDIIYIHEAFQEATLRRSESTCKILDSIEKFQSSEYENLVYIPAIQLFFLSSRYIDELQKFVEDENYRRSLELEPQDLGPTIVVEHSSSNTGDASQQQRQANQIKTTVNDRAGLNGGHQESSRHTHLPKRSAMLLASLTSIVHSAVMTTSNRFSGSTPRKSSDEACKVHKYLIDDSYTTFYPNHTSLPPPISTSN